MYVCVCEVCVREGEREKERERKRRREGELMCERVTCMRVERTKMRNGIERGRRSGGMAVVDSNVEMGKREWRY